MWNFAAIRISIPPALVEFAKPYRGWSRRMALPLLTMLLTLLLIRMPTPPVLGLDGSWSMALLYFHQHGFQFGRDIIFTYGPLGFLVAPTYFGQVPLFRLIWEVGANLALAAALVNIGASFFLTRSIFYYISLCLGVLLAPGAALDLSLPLFTIFWLLSTKATRWYLGIAVIWLAFLSLVKFNLCLEALVALVAASSLAMWHRKFGKAFAIPLLYATAFVLLWLVAGQSPANLPRYLHGGLEITHGYVSAMACNDLSQTSWGLIWLLWLIIIGYAVDLIRRGRLVSADSIWLALYLAFAWCSLWKYGVTRADPSHVVPALVSTMVIASAVPVCFGDRVAFLDLLTPLCLIGVLVTDLTVIHQFPQKFVQRVSNAADRVLRPRHHAEAFSAAESAEYRSHGHPALHEIIGGASVDMITCEQVEVLRENLNYRPRPVFQSYSAYTPWLLRQNLRFYSSNAAPQFVFVRLQPIDGRYPTQEDALLLPELPRRYSIVQRGPGYVLLHRKPRQPTQDQAQRRLKRSIVSLRQEILLPAKSDCALELRARFQPTLRGMLREFFVQPALLNIVLTDEQHQEHRGRIVPQISAGGFLVQPLVQSNADFVDFFQGRMRRAVHSIRFEPVSGSSKDWSKIEVEFWELPELRLQHSSRPVRTVVTP
jgi:hypothetical protein